MTPATGPIFVVGNVHSGTTLLRHIFGRDDTVYIGGGETGFFRFMPAIRKAHPKVDDAESLRSFVRYIASLILTGYARVNFGSAGAAADDPAAADIDDELIERVCRRAGAAASHESVFIITFDEIAAAAGRSRWLEKTPAHVFHVADILAVAPEAKFIELVRDPRAVLASKKSRQSEGWRSRASNPSQSRGEGGFDPWLHALAWRSALRAGDAAGRRFPDRVLRVRYEDLVTDPGATVRKICDFLGLEFNEKLLDVGWINAASLDRQNARGIDASAVDRWKAGLSPAEVAICELVTRREMRALGYAPESRGPSVWFGVLTTSAGTAGELARILYRRWRLGGWSHMTAQLENYRKRIRLMLGSGLSPR